MRLRVLMAAGMAVAALLPTQAASARETSPTAWQFGSDDEKDRVEVQGHSAGHETSPRPRRRSGGWKLVFVEEGDFACNPNEDDVADPIYWYANPDGEVIEVCRDPTPPPPVARFLAQETREDMSVPLAGVRMSPPEGSDHLVNLASWLWVDNWAPVSTSATLGGVTVTVTVTPESVTWDLGAGDPPVVCGAGRPYDPSVPDEAQSTDCSYTYRRSSYGQPGERFRGSSTMRWSVTWTSTTGESGVLPAVSTTRPFAVRVAEGQAVVTDAR